MAQDNQRRQNNQNQGMQQQRQALHLTPEQLQQLPPEALLHVCLEYRSVLLTLLGYQESPYATLAERVIALDLLYTAAAQEQPGSAAGGVEQTTFDVRQVGQRLGLTTQAVRKAYERLAQQGMVHIDAIRPPRKGETQPPLPM